MKVVVVGGHLTPALAVIERLVKESDVTYLGRKHSLTDDSAVSLEYATMQKLGVPFVEITMGKFQRLSQGFRAKELLKMPLGFSQALGALLKIRPDVVLSFGSYVSIPVAFAAKFLRIPLVIHEQTQEAGLANRVVAMLADRICISYESSRRYFPKNKTVLTGNPIRESLYRPKKNKITEFSERLPVVFVTGGSQGSHLLNELVLSSLPVLNKKVNLIHQTGDSKFNDYEKLKEERNKLEFPNRYKLIKFLDPEDFGSVLSVVTLVVGRAGANTVNELIFLNKPALLIPLSFAQKEEQLKNANLLKEVGLAEVLSESIEVQDFQEKVLGMIENIDKYRLNQKIDLKNSPDAIIKILKNAANKN